MVAIESSVPILLVVRRTRRFGVLVAIGFHWLLALDRTHQFVDFSSILTVLFLLFLAPEVLAGLVHRAGRVRARLAARWSSGPELVRLFLLVAAAGVVVTAAGPNSWTVVGSLREVAVFGWIVVGAATFVFVAVTAPQRPRHRRRRLLAGSLRPWMLVIPAIALLNGLTPYLEVKSAFGWNMYSNLAVVDGDSNHLVVRSGLPLSDGHHRLVAIVETNDPGAGVLPHRLAPPRAPAARLPGRPRRCGGGRHRRPATG